MLTFYPFIYLLFTQAPEIKWGRIYGGPGNDYCQCVLECIDKGYIAVGSTNSTGNGGYDVYILKTDSSGLLDWSKFYGGPDDDYGYAISSTRGGYIIVGATNSSGSGLSDIYVIKINENGDSIWARTYGDSLQEIGYSIAETRDGNYLILGTTSSYGAGGIDVYIIKIDTLGEVLWSKTYGGNLDDFGFCVDVTDDGGFIIAGTTFSFGNGNGDIYVLKADSVGETEWVGLYGTDQNETGLCVQQTRDDGYIICGSAYFVLLGYEWCLLRYNRNGSLIWTTFQGSLNDDYAHSIQEIDHNDYVVAGNFAYELYVVRTDTAGYNRWAIIYGGMAIDCAYSVKQTSDGGYIIGGITDSYGAGGYDAYLIKTHPDQLDIEELSLPTDPRAPNDIQVSPNPFRKHLVIKFQIPIRHAPPHFLADWRTNDQTNPKSPINSNPSTCYSLLATLRIYDATGRLVSDFSRLTFNVQRFIGMVLMIRVVGFQRVCIL